MIEVERPLHHHMTVLDALVVAVSVADNAEDGSGVDMLVESTGVDAEALAYAAWETAGDTCNPDDYVSDEVYMRTRIELTGMVVRGFIMGSMWTRMRSRIG